MNKNIITVIVLFSLFLVSTAGAVDGAANLIKNPGFESGKTSWVFYTNGTGTFTAVPPGFEGSNSAKIALGNIGTNIQLYQKGVQLEPNTRYMLRFAAYSTTGHDATVNLLKHGSPYTDYGLSQTFDLGTSWQEFTAEFTTEGFTGTVSDGRFQLFLASFAEAGDTYYFDAIILEKVGVDTIEARLAALENKVTDLETENAALKNLLAGITLIGNDLYIDGLNVHIRDGSGDTDGPVNGLGNLIIGYNELRGSDDDRTGSHNLILGKANNYASYGGLVAGAGNEISGPYSSISGGLQNKASNWFSSISGGNSNTANGWHSSISGGIYNTANGEDSSVSGGYGNTASGNYSSVSGGNNNTASGGYTTVSGGTQNTASDARVGNIMDPEEYVTYAWSAASVSGGYNNIASGFTSTVSGGQYNTASGSSSSVSGGGNNQALEAYTPNGNPYGSLASISGGVGNIADGSASSISGGAHNYAGGCCDTDSASVSGGKYNYAIGMYSSVSGGQYNKAEGFSSSVSGGSNNTAGSYFQGESSSVSGGYQRTATGTYDWVAGLLFEDQ